MSYCDTQIELEANPEAKSLMQFISLGNQDAFRWMWSFWSFTHLIDDSVDKDKKITSEQASESLAEFIEALVQNKFFKQHKAYLYPLIISACSRWFVGDILDGETQEDRIRSEVVRCGDIDVFLGVAFCLGGFGHMQKCAMNCRSYDINRKE
jgi:hypothetical protein